MKRNLMTCGALALVALLACRSAHAQATAKPPYIYNQQEREAVEVVKAWFEAWNTRDPNKIAEFMAEDCVFRADPSHPLGTGRAAFATKVSQSRLIKVFETMKIEEIFVTGTEWDTAVLTKRIDVIGANGGALAGQSIPVAGFFRVKNRTITEWLDAPIIPVGPGARNASAPAADQGRRP